MIKFFMGILFACMLLGSAAPAKAAFSLSYVFDNRSLAPKGGADFIQVTCPAGSVVVSGGWDIAPAFGQYVNVWVSRQFGNSWRVMASNTHNTAFIGFNGYAVCATGVAGMTSYATTTTVTVGSTSALVAATSCTNGGIATGVGFDSNFPFPNNMIVQSAYLSTSTQSAVIEYNSTTASKSFIGAVTCLKNLNASVTQKWGAQLSYVNGATVGSVDCNAGDYAIGGGFFGFLNTASPSTNIQKVRVSGSFPTTTNVRRWSARGYNANTSDVAFLTPIAQCLHLN